MNTMTRLKDLNGITFDALVINAMDNGMIEVRLDDDDYKIRRDHILMRDVEVSMFKDPHPYIMLRGRKMYFYSLPELRLEDTFRNEVNFHVADKDVFTKKEYKGIWPFGYSESRECLRTGRYETGRYKEISMSFPLSRAILVHEGLHFDHAERHTAKRHKTS